MSPDSSYKKAAYSARAIFLFQIVGSLLGLFRQILYAFFFGTGRRIEAFFAATTITNVSTKLFQTGALSNVFLPIFMEAKQKDAKMAWKLTSNLLTLLLLASGFLCCALFLAAPRVVPFFVPGFGAEQKNLIVLLFRIILPTILLDILSTLMSAVLHANRCFVAVEIASFFGNVLMVILLFLLTRKIGIVALAVSLLSASLAQTLLLAATLWREGFRFYIGLSLQQEELLRILKFMTPFFGYMVVMQIQAILTTAVLSFLPQGSLSAVRYGSDFFTRLVPLISLPFSTVIFSDFSELALSQASEMKERFVIMLRKSLQMLMFLTVPLTVLTIAFRVPMVQAIYQRGIFDRTSVWMTSRVFALFCIGFFFESATLIFKKLLFAFKKNYAVVAIASAGQLVYLFFLFVFVKFLGYLGIAAASSLSTFVLLVMMVGYVHAKVFSLSSLSRDSSASFFKMVVAGVVMGFSCLGLNRLFEGFHLWAASNLTHFLQTATLCLVGLAAYLVVSWVFHIEELRIVWSVYDLHGFWRRWVRGGYAA